MFINKLNQLYKPKRILYYTEDTDKSVEAFCNGESIPQMFFASTFCIKLQNIFVGCCKTVL